MNLNSNSEKNTQQETQNTKLYIGNLPFSVNDAILKDFFEEALGKGAVTSSQVVLDRDSGRSKGFGFVSFASPEITQKAANMKGQEITPPDGNKRAISIDQAHDRKPKFAPGASRPGFQSGGFSRQNDRPGSGRNFTNSSGPRNRFENSEASNSSFSQSRYEPKNNSPKEAEQFSGTSYGTAARNNEKSYGSASLNPGLNAPMDDSPDMKKGSFSPSGGRKHGAKSHNRKKSHENDDEGWD
jgi:RNA recognition motif-containing protein